MSMSKNDYISKIKLQYSYLEDWRIDEVFEIAKRELFITLYSTNTSIINEDTQIPYIYEYKVYEAMKEIIDTLKQHKIEDVTIFSLTSHLSRK